MITTSLIENILTYINRLGIVHKEQVVKMFSDSEETGMIEMCLTSLTASSHINYNARSDTFQRRNSVSRTEFTQQLITKAAWILSDMGSQKVRDFFVVDYPSQIFIIGENNVCYDVTVFTYDTLSPIKMTIQRKRQTLLPPDVEDECIHIALLPDTKMAADIASLPFDTYCVLTEDKTPEYYEF